MTHDIPESRDKPRQLLCDRSRDAKQHRINLLPHEQNHCRYPETFAKPIHTVQSNSPPSNHHAEVPSRQVTNMLSTCWTTMVKVAPAAAGCDHGEGCPMVKDCDTAQDRSRIPNRHSRESGNPYREIQLKHKPTGHTESQNTTADTASRPQNTPDMTDDIPESRDKRRQLL